MDCISLLCAVFLVYLCQVQGSKAVTPVFVQKGKDVLLDVMTADVLEGDFDGLWKFTDKVIIVKFYSHRGPTVTPVYTGRVDFSVKNYSVKLKNLQEADSGVYTARVTGTQTEQILAEYNITIQDPVSPVKLTVDSVSNSSDSCNLTVTCSALDSHISSTFRCDTKTCSEEEGERSEVTTSGASLHVCLVNDSIICNHSNQVSWTKNMTDIQHFCPRHGDADKQNDNNTVHVVVFITILTLIIFVPAVLYLRKRGKHRSENIENTIYDVAQVKATAQPLVASNDAAGLSPTSTYCLVGPHTGSMGSTETRGNTPPESVYAQVQKLGPETVQSPI